MSANGFGLNTVDMTVASGLISATNSSISFIFSELVIGSSHIVKTTRSPRSILYGPKYVVRFAVGWLAPMSTIFLLVLIGGIAAPLPSKIANFDSTSFASFAPFFMLVMNTSPAIPPPQRLQPIVNILLINASSQWSLAA